MTNSDDPIWGTRYASMPMDVDIVCPRCAGLAIFSPAFTYLTSDQHASTPSLKPNARRVQWSRGFLEERFPNDFPWSDKDNPFTQNPWQKIRSVAGVCTCPSCSRRAKHVLDWPKDAYHVVETRAGVLWAWNRDMLVAAKSYVESTDRNLGAHGCGNYLFLRALPSSFLLVKNRSNISSMIDRFLLANTAG